MVKQETLKEAADKFADDCTLISDVGTYIGFIKGAKWMQERMYSEEEVLETIRQYALEEHLITSSKPDKWFEQNKKQQDGKSKIK
jgi:hypothetical protein